MVSTTTMPPITRFGRGFIVRILGLFLCGIVLLSALRTFMYDDAVRLMPSWNSGSAAPSNEHNPPVHVKDECPPREALEDILVIFKTGATEIHEKLPVHFETTLRCIPNIKIVSDFEEDFHGHHVEDVLADVSPAIQKSEPEFEVYNRLKTHGRGAITPEELAEWSAAQNTIYGATENLAWKLDKWKFVPMLNKTYRAQPDAKWFIFMEADTYINWPNMLAWLDQFDPVKRLYLGEQMQIGDILFGYGGTGYVLSNPAMRKALKYQKANAKEIEEFTSTQWAGDMVLGWVLGQAGIELHWSWPNLQGQVPSDLDYFAVGWHKRQWCYAAVSYHHMKPSDIVALDRFERSWEGSQPILHRDVFLNYVHPQVAGESERKDWDNLSDFAYPPPGHQKPVESFEACRAICEYHGACLQFSYANGICRISATVKLGHKAAPPEDPAVETTRSGWMVDRIKRFLEYVPECEEGEWVLPK